MSLDAILDGALARQIVPKHRFTIVLISTMASLSSLGQIASAQAEQPGAAAGSRVLPGHVTTTTATPKIDMSAGISGKASKSYNSPGFLATTTSSIEGYTILEYKGLVEGAAVRVPTWNEDASAGQQQVYGGSIDSYAHLCEEARVQAFTTLVSRAKEIGANAVIGIHFDSQVMPLDKGKFASGVVCVGTAILTKRK